ncbi:MAG: DUF1684 domain-containing protein [Bacteroidales bacterium]|nr:DUF1684 domain-containing protein [Bacteroidales bacterium]
MKTNVLLFMFLYSLSFCTTLYSQNENQSSDPYKEQIENLRNLKNQQMMNSETSPLPQSQIEGFTGLSYFPVDAKYKINGQFTLNVPQTEERLNTTSGTAIMLVKYGSVTFEYEGSSYTFSVFKNKNFSEFGDNAQQLFIPFFDGSNNLETNANGRYLPVDMPDENNTMLLDFNLAINPFSAYNSQLFSVIPPSGNTVEQIIGSGERKYEDR